MRIHVQLVGILKAKAPADGPLAMDDGATIDDALEALGIGGASVHVCSVNGAFTHDRRTVLRDGDALTVLPPVAGG
ncbi:MAG: MoaD/ThiS family protein [Planctomycetes bacterium]|nr:MoaD/ThiS family protein [Planctomycetota bacterium]